MSYTQKQISFKSSNKSTTLKGVLYLPEGDPKAIVQIAHGMCEHMQRYDEFAQYLCKKGYLVCGHDHIGHGKSLGSQEKAGYFAHKDGWKCLIADCYRFTQMIKSKYPDLPYFLLGHSMGSFVARLYAARYTYALSGLMLSGTGGYNPLAAPGIVMCDAVMTARGEFFVSPTMDKMVFGSSNKGFGDNPHPKAWLTRDMALAESYLQDSSCNFVFTTSGFKDLFTLNRLANQAPTYQNTPHALPILLFSGEQDPIGAKGKGVEAVAEHYRRSGKQDVSVILYPQGRHEMLNEINRQSVYRDVEEWLEAHLPPSVQDKVPTEEN